MPHTGGHGYLICRATKPNLTPAEATVLVSDIKHTAVPPGVTIDMVSLMEKNPNGRSPSAPAEPGDTVIIQVRTTDPHRSDPAHTKIQGLVAVVEALPAGNAAKHLRAGLSNHWCCYADE